jgi:NRDE-2, necessary for RNA interference
VPVAPVEKSDPSCEHNRGEHKGEHEVQRKSHRHQVRSSRHGRSDVKISSQTPETAPALTTLARRRTAEPDDESIIYKSDRKGDPSILQYGGLGSFSVPSYFRNGRGSVIGVEPFRRIDRDVSSDKKVVLQSHETLNTPRKSLFSKTSLPLSRASKILVPQVVADRVLDHSADFIALTRKRKRGSESPELSSEEVDFRSIQGKARPSSGPEDPDLQYTSESDAEYEYANHLDEEVKRKNSELGRLCKKDPQDLSAWISFIDHQEKMIRLGRSVTTAGLTAPEKQSLADIKVSIYQEALKGLSGNSHARETLWLGLLQQGGHMWEAKTLAAKWEEALKQNPDSVKVWLGNLNHLQSSFSNFRFGKSSPCRRRTSLLMPRGTVQVGLHRIS